MRAVSTPENVRDVAVPAGRPHFIRRLYDWVLHWAQTPYGLVALVVLAFVESSFFPVPPDVLLLALALATPKKAFRYAAWCTLGSVLGGLLGYYLGYGFWSVFEPVVLKVPGFTAARIEYVTGLYREYDFWAVFVAAFTPIPYKVFTITAGISQLNLPAFILASVVGRGARFFLVALVIRAFGEKAKQFIDKYFNMLTIAATLLLIGGFLLLKLVA